MRLQIFLMPTYVHTQDWLKSLTIYFHKMKTTYVTSLLKSKIIWTIMGNYLLFEMMLSVSSPLDWIAY